MYITKGKTLLTLMMVVGALLVGTGAAIADSPPQGAAPTVVMATATVEEDGQVMVTAQFAGPQGQPVSGQEVGFFLEVDFLGQSQVSLGSATTDATGATWVRYTPTWDGTHTILARLADGPEVMIAFDVSGSRGLYEPESPALSIVREWTPVVVGVVVLLVWATVALVLVRTTYGIIAAAPRERRALWRAPGSTRVPLSRLRRSERR